MIKLVLCSMAKATEQILNLVERAEEIPWYWVGLFTSLAFFIASIFVKKIDSISYTFFYGGEYGAVGAALAQGRGFSDPFSMGTGVTAWVSPLLPAIMGGVFYITSLKIKATYWILLLIKICSLGFGTGLIWDVLRKSRRGFALITYLWMGVLYYVYNIELFSLYHDEWLIFLVISIAFWAWHQRNAFSGRVALIIALSAAALGNPILWGALFIVMLVFSMTILGNSDQYVGCRPNDRGRSFARNSLWIATGFSFLLIIGWTARNWIQMGMFAPVKSNAGYEIYQAQIASRNGVPDASTFAKHPIIMTSEEHRAFGEMGETAFIRARRDAAIRSITDDPIGFCRRVANRFTNAFLHTATPVNTAVVDSKIRSVDLERLRRAGFVVHRNDRTIWIDLDDPDKDLTKVLPSLGLEDPQSVLDNWRAMSEGHYWYRFSWDRIIGGCLTGGMPWVLFFAAMLMRRRSEWTPAAGWAGLFLFLYLTPYVLISHYIRYQVPLLGMQAILLTAGTVALLSMMQRR